MVVVGVVDELHATAITATMQTANKYFFIIYKSVCCKKSFYNGHKFNIFFVKNVKLFV